ETRDLLARIKEANARLFDTRLGHRLDSVKDRKSFEALARELSTSPEVAVDYTHGLEPAQHRKALEKHLPRWLELAGRSGTPPLPPEVAGAMYKVIGKGAREGVAVAPVERYRQQQRRRADPFVGLYEALVDCRVAVSQQPPAERQQHVRA